MTVLEPSLPPTTQHKHTHLHMSPKEPKIQTYLTSFYLITPKQTWIRLYHWYSYYDTSYSHQSFNWNMNCNPTLRLNTETHICTCLLGGQTSKHVRTCFTPRYQKKAWIELSNNILIDYLLEECNTIRVHVYF